MKAHDTLDGAIYSLCHGWIYTHL